MLVTHARLCHSIVAAFMLGCGVYDEALLERRDPRSVGREDAADGGADGAIGKPSPPSLDRDATSEVEGGARLPSAGEASPRQDGGTTGGAGGPPAAEGGRDTGAADAGIDEEDAGPPPEPAPCTEPNGRVWMTTGHCYFPLTVLNSWYVSRDRCRELGARLVSITSPEEQAFVGAIVGDMPRWTGLARFGSPYFSWLEDEPILYENWEAGEPSTMTEAAVALRNGSQKWFDDAVSVQYGAMCERAPK